MRLFGILLLVLILAAGGAYVYFGTQDWKGRQTIAAAGLRHLLLLQGLPLEGDAFAADDETPFEVPMAGGESSRTVSKKLLEKYFSDNTSVAAAPTPAPGGAEPPAPRASLATNAAVVSQSAEVKRVLAELQTRLGAAAAPADKAALLAGWLLLQAETMNERLAIQALIAAGDADGLAHRLDLKFYRVAPKLYQSESGALAPERWKKLQDDLAAGAADVAKPPVATGEADRRDRLAHLLVHLDREAAWQKRVAVVVGLRRYVSAVATQAARFREMRDQVELPIAGDQAVFQQHITQLQTDARQDKDRARATAEERAKLAAQLDAANDAVAQRGTQLKELRAQLDKVRAEVDQLLVRQTGIEQQLYEIQREVSLTLEEVYRLEALLTDVERERYGLPPRR